MNRVVVGALSGALLFSAAWAGPHGAWTLRAGVVREVPRTRGPDGYGNHGKFDGTNAAELNAQDRANANWDQATGLSAELVRETRWRLPLGLHLGWDAYLQGVFVDTEFNETQEDWVYATATGGGCASPSGGAPWRSKGEAGSGQAGSPSGGPASGPGGSGSAWGRFG
ncbi:hypothetical protein JCM30394_29620 [Deferrisoma palaeochoriense]